MQPLQIKKLLITLLLTVIAAFSLSICACAQAQIESLSVIDNTIYAKVSGDDAANANLFAVSHNEGLLGDVFFAPICSDGSVQLSIGKASEYELYIWDKGTLAPLSVSYNLKDGSAFPYGSEVAVPQYNSNSYSFNQDDNVMIVSQLSSDAITGFVAGVETTYVFTPEVVVLGLSDKMSDVVPGSVVLLGTTADNRCGAIELLATIGIPVSKETFVSNFGVYSPSDGSSRYQNIVTQMFSKSGNKIVTFNLPDPTTTLYNFKSGGAPCYRVGIAMNDSTPVITVTKNVSNAVPSIFAPTDQYVNYLYLRFDTQIERVIECVYYCVPTDFDPWKGDGEYSDIFSTGEIIIIE